MVTVTIFDIYLVYLYMCLQSSPAGPGNYQQCLPQGFQMHQLHLLLDKKQWQVSFYNIEGWHRGFQSLIGSCHPNIWTFLGKLKRQQSLHHVQLTQILAGDVIPQRKKYQDAASCVLHLVQGIISHLKKNGGWGAIVLDPIRQRV
jgi:hypothetical protein